MPRCSLRGILATSVLLAASGSALATKSANTPAMPTNPAIVTLAGGGTIFAVQVQGGAGLEEGKRFANGKADIIIYEMEHGAFDLGALRAFIQGTVEGRPAGVRRLPVLVTLPLLGTDPAAMRSNSWMIRQVLAMGASGIILCHAESPEAVRLFVEAARYPFAPGADPKEVHRGFHSEDFAASMWGLKPADYLAAAEPWPLDPAGGLLLGVKIESPRAAEQAADILAVPGLALVEFAPGDQSFFLFPKPGAISREQQTSDPRMVESRREVLAEARRRNIGVLTLCSAANVSAQIESGVRACYALDDATIEKGREAASRVLGKR